MKKARPKKTRLNVRLPADLVTWAKEFSKKKNTTVTQLLVDFLTAKREMENGS